MQAPEPASGQQKQESLTTLVGSGPPREELHESPPPAQGSAPPGPPGPDAPGTTLKVEVPGSEDEALGTRISQYKLLERVGEGGCGVVYVAEQTEPVRRRVALKVIKLGMDTKQVVARFEAERQALAMMDHPNIAKVLDAGATETGRPYFVMELVRGIRITDYCDQTHLPTQERLDLFIQVCHAIQHAHQKGIIHRDIKPSNILVTLQDGAPVPKVIDFGIAKATEGRLTETTIYTQLNQFIGTPAYTSPEQAEMSGLDIDTRSDIYSLGVLLYELLVGSTPFDAKELLSQGIDAMRKTIREKEPLRPSTHLAGLEGEKLTTTASRRGIEAPKLIHLLRGDLDWIVMKCLEKDRRRRYETANALAADLERHLTHEAVLARPPSTVYRLRKSVRRNRLAYSAAAAVVMALGLGVAFSSWQAVRALRAEKLAGQRLVESEKARGAAQASEARAVAAEREATAKAAAERAAREESDAIAGFMGEVFQSPDPAIDGRTITVAATLDRAATRLETDLASQPELRAQLQATLGRTYYALGLYREAVQLQEKARDYYLANSGPEHPKTLAALHNLATYYYAAGRREDALKVRDGVLTLRRKVLGPEHPDTLAAMSAMASSCATAGRGGEALKLREEALTLRRKVSGPDHPATVSAMLSLATSYETAGRRQEALKLKEEALRFYRETLKPGHPDLVGVMNNVAFSYDVAGRRAEALKLREEALTLSRKVLGPEHPTTLAVMSSLAFSYDDAGRGNEGLKLREEVLGVRRKVLGPGHPDTTGIMKELASYYYSHFGRKEEGLKLQEELVPLLRQRLGPENPETLRTMGDLANYYSGLNRPDEALRLREEVLALRIKVLGMEHPETLEAMNDLAQSYATGGRRDEAPKLWGQVLTGLEERSREKPADSVLAMKVAALEVWFAKEADYATTCRRMLQWAADQTGPDAAERAAKITNLRPSADPKLLQAALALARRSVETGHTNSFFPWYQLSLGMAAYRNGHYPEADRLLSAAELGSTNTWRPEIRAGTAKFYRAMSLFQQGKGTEASQLFTAAAAAMKPLPAPDQWPLTGRADHDDLILWLACKEAKALLNAPGTARP